MDSIIIDTKNLTVGYEKKAIVNDVDLEINKGEIVTLIGSNGSGKTTVLRTLCNQLRALDGVVYLDGKDLKSMSNQDIAKTTAVVFTEDNIKEPVTCFDFVAMGRYPYTDFLGKLRNEDYETIKHAMEQTKTTDLMDQIYTKLSDGQRQRVLLARALCQNPDILILDEPTTYLDVKYKLEFLTLLYRLAKEKNIAVVMSLHELDMARQISDQLVCIKNGRVDKFGSPDEVFTKGYVNYLFDISVGQFDEESFSAFIVKEH